jgi:hypothetical protein
MMFGLVFTGIHNRYRRLCSLIHDQHDMNPPPGELFGFQLLKPTVCAVSEWLMWGSILAFLIAGLDVAIAGLCTIGHLQP